MEEARALFRDPATTEFVIVTIPTVMAAAESARLAKALRAESVPVNTILINQVSSEQPHACLCAGVDPQHRCTLAPLQTACMHALRFSRRTLPSGCSVINQVVKEDATERFLAMRRKDQQRALQHMREDPGLRCVAA